MKIQKAEVEDKIERRSKMEKDSILKGRKEEEGWETIGKVL